MSTVNSHLNANCIAYIDASGELLQALPTAYENPSMLTEMYKKMVFARTFDAKAIALQRSGRLGTYASGLGQEAVNIGIAAAMQSEDVLLPSFREHALQLGRGVTPEEILQFWSGDERGSNFAVPTQDFPVSIVVAGHAPHAVGVALALKLKGCGRAALCVLGDGATSKGDFYEALNGAGVWQLPLVFVVVNNQWAISTPRSRQTAASTLAQKSFAGGIPGVQADGNDVVAVTESVSDALVSARAGGGPTLVECVTYRLGDHTTADDASRYRNDNEVAQAWLLEPIARLRRYLQHQGKWTDVQDQEYLEDCERRVEAAVSEFAMIPPPNPAMMFDSLYAKLPESLVQQRAELIASLGQVDG